MHEFKNPIKRTGSISVNSSTLYHQQGPNFCNNNNAASQKKAATTLLIDIEKLMERRRDSKISHANQHF